MVTPNPRPIPRFIADTSQEGIPHGRFVEQLREAFAAACAELSDLPDGAEVPPEIDWFPERAWGGRVWVPCSALTESEEGSLELFGHVSYVLPAGGEPRDFEAKADFTDVLAADNPDWKIDLNDDVIGRWRGENGRAGSGHPDLGPPPGPWRRRRRHRRARRRDRRPGRDLPGPLHADRPRRPRGLRRRRLRRGQALEPAGDGARVREPLRGLKKLDLGLDPARARRGGRRR